MVNMALDGVIEAEKAKQTEAAAATITRLLRQARASQPAVQAPIWPAAAVPQPTPPRTSLLEPLPVSDDPRGNSPIKYVNLVTAATPARGPQTRPLPDEEHQVDTTGLQASQPAAPAPEARSSEPGLLELLGPLEMPAALTPAETARPAVPNVPPATSGRELRPIPSRAPAPKPRATPQQPRPASDGWLWALDPNPLHRPVKALPLHPGPDKRWRIVAQELREVRRSVQLIAYQVLEPPLAWLSDMEHASGLINFDRLAVRGIRAVVPMVQHWRQAVARSLDDALHKWRALLNRVDASVDNLSFQLDHSARLLQGGGAAGQLQVARVTHQLNYATNPLVPVPGRGRQTSALPPVQFALWRYPPAPQVRRVTPLAHTAVNSPLAEPEVTRRAQETTPRSAAVPTRPRTPAPPRSAPATIQLSVPPETRPLQTAVPYSARPELAPHIGPRQPARTLADFKRSTSGAAKGRQTTPKPAPAFAPSISSARRRAAPSPPVAAAKAVAAGRNSDKIVIPTRRQRRRRLQPRRGWLWPFRSPRAAFAEDAFLI